MDVKRATVKDFDVATYTATVQMDGSLSLWLAGIAVARNIVAAEMIAGRKCAVIWFDEANPGDAVVVGVWA